MVQTRSKFRILQQNMEETSSQEPAQASLTVSKEKKRKKNIC